MNASRTKGLVLVFTGDGKGKTTAALGAALRAAGQGFRVLILQFMKKKEDVGELMALGQTHLPIIVKQFGRRVFFRTRTCEAMDINIAHQGLAAFEEALAQDSYDLIVLDEINMAVHFGMLKVEEVLTALEKRPPHLHVILTGRNASDEILARADLVTEMKEVKHPYNQGIKGQKGIEY
jgi:cob(I)alamin adenosyltransferase